MKQSAQIWYNTLATYLKKLDFEFFNANLSVFIKDTIIIVVYVDDFLFSGPKIDDIKFLKGPLSKRFQMTDLGPYSYYLGMAVTWDQQNRTIWFSQIVYIKKVLWDCGMANSKPMSTLINTYCCLQKAKGNCKANFILVMLYQSTVGSIMYIMLGTWPDIDYAVSVVNCYRSNPTPAHHRVVKKIFQYLKSTKDLQLIYKEDLQLLSDYTNSDWAGDHNTRRSTLKYVFNVGSGAIS